MTKAAKFKNMGELFDGADKVSLAPKPIRHWTDLQKSNVPKVYRGKTLRTTPTYPPLDPEHRKRLTGAPTDYRPEHNTAVLEAMSEGYSLSGFAGKLGVTRQLLDRWADKHASFSDACARAKSARLHWWETQALEIARTGGQGSQATMVIFGLKNMGSDEWREKQELTIKGEVTLASIVDASLKAIEGPVIEHEPAADPDAAGKP